MSYVDLSVNPQKAIDINYLITKIKDNGYSTFAIDYAFNDDTVYK